MGCSVSEPRLIEINRPMSNMTDNTSSLIPPKKSQQENNNPLIVSQAKEKPDMKTTPQELINQFNRNNFKNGKGIQLNILKSAILTISNKHNNTPHVINEEVNYFTALNQIDILKPNQSNSPYSIENNEAYMNLLSNLKQNHSFKINTSLSFKLSQSQIIYHEYSFEIKLRSITRNTYDTHHFNQLDHPVLFLFFDILSHEAMKKIKEILAYQKSINSIPAKHFLFLPIMNIFTKETDTDLTIEKNILSQYDIDDCYILTTPLNACFMKVFVLDYIEKNKAIIINVNSEVCYINNDQAEYLSVELIEYYLHMRRSTAIRESFTEQVKEYIIDNMSKKPVYKELYKKLSADYIISLFFLTVNEMKYPIEINIKHTTKDRKVINEIISQLKEDIKNHKTKSHNVFYTTIEEKNVKTELIEAFDYFHKLITVDNGIDASIGNYQLIIDTTTNDFALMKKNYLVQFNITKANQRSFGKILEVFSLNLYNNPQFAKMKGGYILIPQPGIDIKMQIDKCLVIKLFKEKMKQIAYEDSNTWIKYQIRTNVVIVMNPNYVMKDDREKMKVRELMVLMKNKGIKYTIVMVSYSVLDAQKLRWLNIDELYDSNNEKDSVEKIYLSSSDIENYSYMNYYSEDVTVKLFIINKGILDSFIDIDLISLESIKELSDNAINSNNDNDNMKILKRLKNKTMKHDHKKAKEQLKGLLIQKFPNAIKSSVYTSLVHTISYKKQISFTDKTSFSASSPNYLSINLNIFYSDHLEDSIPLKDINKICQNQSITSSFIKLQTSQITLNMTKPCIICQLNITSQSFYTCLECLENKDHIYMCESCYSEVKLMHNKEYEEDQFFNDIVMNSCDLTKSLSRKWSHHHPLVYCYSHKSFTKCRYYTQFYHKYINKSNRSMKRCCFCDEGYVDADTTCWDIIVSHMNKGKDVQREEDAEIVLCDECFKGRKFMKECEKDIEATMNNILVLRLHYSFNKV